MKPVQLMETSSAVRCQAANPDQRRRFAKGPLAGQRDWICANLMSAGGVLELEESAPSVGFQIVLHRIPWTSVHSGGTGAGVLGAGN